MPNFAVETYSTSKKNSIEDALDALETEIETVDDTKTLRFCGIVGLNRDREACVGWLIYDT